MASVRSCFTSTDQERQLRLQLAWIDGDKTTLDLVLDEVVKDPAGAPRLLFALVDFSARLGEQAHPGELTTYLRQELLSQQAHPDTAEWPAHETSTSGTPRQRQ